MSSRHIPGLILKIGLLFFISGISRSVYGQSQKGKVLSGETNSGIGFVNIGIIGRNKGTVSDKSGNYKITIDSIYDNDSLRFSMIGYESKTFLVGDFKKDSIKNVYLTPRVYKIQEVHVIYHKPRKIRLGTSVTSDDLRSGFASNDLGSEMGIKVNVRRPVKLTDINLNVAVCTFDSVTYRLNIYKSVNKADYINILTQPVYVSFSKDRIDKVVSFDLSKYSIVIDGDVLIALELYKDLGEGRLLFNTEFFTGTTYHRKASEAYWTEARGVIGMYLHGLLIR